MTEKIVFNRDTIAKLNDIAKRLLEFMYLEIEQLDELDSKEKMFAHYWIIKRYMDGIQKAFDELEITGVVIKEAQVNEK